MTNSFNFSAEEIFDHPQLEKLIILGSPIFQRDFPLIIPDKFDRLPNLKSMHLNYLYLAPLPESIFNLPKLELLDLHHGYTREIPSWIGRLKSLKELELSSKGFNSLPPSIGDLESLEILDISYSGISNKFPKTMCNLNNLQKIWARKISISCLDPSITQIKNLKEIVIGHPSDIISPYYKELFNELKKQGCRVSLPYHEKNIQKRLHDQKKNSKLDKKEMKETSILEKIKNFLKDPLKFYGISFGFFTLLTLILYSETDTVTLRAVSFILAVFFGIMCWSQVKSEMRG